MEAIVKLIKHILFTFLGLSALILVNTGYFFVCVGLVHWVESLLGLPYSVCTAFILIVFTIALLRGLYTYFEYDSEIY